MEMSALQKRAWANQGTNPPPPPVAAAAVPDANSGRAKIQPVARAAPGTAGAPGASIDLMDVIGGLMQSIAEAVSCSPSPPIASVAQLAPAPAPATATATATTPPAAPTAPAEVAPPSVPVAADQPGIADVWNADHQADPYRVYQQMDEHGWTAADLAQASGMTEQQAGDWLTRLGAQAGFGGAMTVGRDATDDPFTAAMTAAQQSGSGPGWGAAAPESRAKDDPDDSGTPGTAFDVGAFTQWYVGQDTPEAQAFARDKR